MEEKRKNTLKRLLKVILWIAGIWAALLIIMQTVLSSAVLGRIVDKVADEYIDGDLQFRTVKVNMFRRFPNVALIMEDVSLTYPAERFAEQESRSVQGRLLYHGGGETADTLASFRHFSASVNVAALLGGRIHVPHVVMVKPRIFAHSYDENTANWNMFRLPASEEDTTETVLPPMAVGRVRLVNHPHIVYTDSRDTLFAMIDVKSIAFDGHLNTRRASRNRIGLTLDSMMVAGRMAADTIGVGMDKLHIHEHNDHVDIDVEAKALLATRAFGRMRVPVSIHGTAGILKDTVPALSMNGFTADIAAIPISFDMNLRKMHNHLDIDGSFSVNGCRVEDMIDGFVKNIIPEAEQIRTDASIMLSGTCRGCLGNGGLPDINAVLTIPDASVSHRDIKHEVRLALGAGINTDAAKRINVSIDKAEVATYGLDLALNGGVADVLGEDPAIKINGSFRASADSLLTFLPEDSGIEAAGEVRAEINGDIRMSQLDIYNFGLADISGKISSDRLTLSSPKDTVRIGVENLAISASPETKTSVRDPEASFRLLGINGNIGRADISLKEALTVKIVDLDFAAKNSVDDMVSRDSTKVGHLGGHLGAKVLSIEDREGMQLALSGTSNSFQMMPKRGNPAIPVLSLSSRNTRLMVKNDLNRIILTNADITAEAAMNSIERRQRVNTFMDSLARANPDVPRDSLMAHMRMSMRRNMGQRAMGQRRIVREVPEWMQEDDFKSGDLNFTIDGIVADYFRKWDINGGLKVRSGILMTPYLPQRNMLSGMEISVNNNEVKIDRLKILTGNSELMAEGSLSGLRRALLGRGAYNLDLDLTSSKMNASQLLAALNRGASMAEKADAEKLKDVSDSEFLEMMTADSLDTEFASPLIIVPSDLNADIRLRAENITFSDLRIDELTADIIMKERCMQITNTIARTNMGDVNFDAFFATRSKQNIKTGFNLNMIDVTSEKVIAMMPAIDTIMPLLKSFKGMLNCDIAATADLDTNMNVKMPTINGVIRIGGYDLTMSDDKLFTNLAKKLKFKNSKKATIDQMTVEGVIRDNTLEVFPFILELDRYTLALSGIQNLDMSYKYHASIIRSPILFKLGVDLYGPDFDNMKFKIGKAKYRNKNVPVFSDVIDETRINLTESIRNIFDKGVEIAVREHEMQRAIISHRQNIGFVNAVNQELEEFSAEEQRQIEEEQERVESGVVDSLSISRSLDYIMNKENTENE